MDEHQDDSEPTNCGLGIAVSLHEPVTADELQLLTAKVDAVRDVDEALRLGALLWKEQYRSLVLLA